MRTARASSPRAPRSRSRWCSSRSRCSSGFSACRCRSGRTGGVEMELLSNLGLGLSVALGWQNLIYCFIGCFLGTLVGVLPGIGPVATVAMLLPFTFGLGPTPALIMLAGIYYGAQYAGSATSIPVNIPGEFDSRVHPPHRRHDSLRR